MDTGAEIGLRSTMYPAGLPVATVKETVSEVVVIFENTKAVGCAVGEGATTTDVSINSLAVMTPPPLIAAAGRASTMG